MVELVLPFSWCNGRTSTSSFLKPKDQIITMMFTVKSHSTLVLVRSLYLTNNEFAYYLFGD